jgi:hypothetical protein
MRERFGSTGYAHKTFDRVSGNWGLTTLPVALPDVVQRLVPRMDKPFSVQYTLERAVAVVPERSC